MGACENFENFLQFLANNWQGMRCMVGAGSDHNISNSTDLNLIEELEMIQALKLCNMYPIFDKYTFVFPAAAKL